MNVVCDNALIGGFAAQVKPINARFVEDVCRDFDINMAPAASSAAPVSSLSEKDAAKGPHVEARHELVAAPRVPAPTSGEAPPLDSSVTPMFGGVNRKRRFSFF